MCHSPKVEDGMKNYVFQFLDPDCGTLFVEERSTAINPKPL